jgi:hypothetical protein
MGSLGYTGSKANYMTAPIYACALVVSTLVGFSSDHFNEKPFHVLGATIFAGVSFIIVALVPSAGVKYAFVGESSLALIEQDLSCASQTMLTVVLRLPLSSLRRMRNLERGVSSFLNIHSGEKEGSGPICCAHPSPSRFPRYL